MARPSLAPSNQFRSDPSNSGQATGRMFFNSNTFQELYDNEPFALTHNLSSLDLFSPDSLAALADKFANAPRDFFIAASAPTSGTDFYSVPRVGRTPREAIEEIAKINCRVLLKRPEKYDPRFRELLHSLFQQILDLRGELRREHIERLEGAVIVSSGSTTTPIHFDPVVGFFAQIAGEKCYHVYPPASVLESELERFYVWGRYDIGNVTFGSLDGSLDHVFRLGPGKGLHQPCNAPHWVQTGASTSVSYTLVYQTSSSQALARTRAFNHCLRELGISPSQPGVHRSTDTAKALTMRAAVPLQLARRLIRKLRRGVRFPGIYKQIVRS
jgi:hypothetical protein